MLHPKKSKIFSVVLISLSMIGLLLFGINTIKAELVISDNYEIYYGEDTTALDNAGEYYIGEITEIKKEYWEEDSNPKIFHQVLEIKINVKPTKYITIDSDMEEEYLEAVKVKVGDKVIVNSIENGDGETQNFITDKYRTPAIIFLLTFFIIITVIFAKYRGLTSIFGLLFSLFILTTYVVPEISHGSDPFLVSIIGAILIAPVSIYLAHGFTKQTTIAIISTVLSLIVGTIISISFVSLTQLSGVGSEEAYFLKNGADNFNIKGLLLGGMVFGILGILDDVTTAQTAAMVEVLKANPLINFRQLYASGLNIGKEHMSAVVNTLVLAYVGSSFPLLLLITQVQLTPLWVQVNSEFVAEEIIRMIAGSCALILSVPISTIIAAYLLKRKTIIDKYFKD
jgi:uncharacterized membrane protein